MYWFRQKNDNPTPKSTIEILTKKVTLLHIHRTFCIFSDKCLWGMKSTKKLMAN